MKKTFYVVAMSIGAVLINSQVTAQAKETAVKMEQKNSIIVIQLSIEGMHCQEGCANGIDILLGEQDGVVKSTTQFETSSSEIEYDANVVSEKEIIALIQERGFKAARKANPKKKEQ
ncbi:MAG TPA: heavy metal-associated domain-containing protein [Cyclobacteriaceae bacterium]|mgnify:CR=1 FL=1|jgi:copper chaperone CopZ|nr:heavy metal-associated domain-containing protein [Cyclobacteriaceae bacterium]HRK52685.1 heavy metal-associated domain-containing protein [Cyclobacteriaceae bacterium]